MQNWLKKLMKSECGFVKTNLKVKIRMLVGWLGKWTFSSSEGLIKNGVLYYGIFIYGGWVWQWEWRYYNKISILQGINY